MSGTGVPSIRVVRGTAMPEKAQPELGIGSGCGGSDAFSPEDESDGEQGAMDTPVGPGRRASRDDTRKHGEAGDGHGSKDSAA